MNKFIKSPMNYIGGKYKLLPQIIPLFPKDVNTFIDLFCGGGDVFSNVKAKRVIANDNNYHVIDIFKWFQSKSLNEILEYINGRIEEYSLSVTNADGYNALRDEYNKTRKPEDLFVLLCYSFNHQLRFNSKHEFNCSFGKNRSCFNDNIKKNLTAFHSAIQGVVLTTNDFSALSPEKLGVNDFVYADPPYLITVGSYNDGKRGFEGWTQAHDEKLFDLLDRFDARGVKFAMSNVTEHKGKQNERLIEWASKYNVHELNFNYDNSNYQADNKANKTIEVLITNY